MSRASRSQKLERDNDRDTEQPHPASDGGQLGVRERLALLRDEWPTTGVETEEAQPRLKLPTTTIRRALKTLAALALIVALGWSPVQRLFSTTSAEATVNARVITLRSPIDGRIVDWRPETMVGAPLHSQERLLQIENSRADRSRLDELQRTLATLVDQRVAASDRLTALQKQRNEQVGLFETFKHYRIAHIEVRRRELVAEREAAVARLEAAAAARERAVKLIERGVQTQAANDQAMREHKVALAELAVIERRLDASDVELTAARQGTFVADGFNDIPRSAQRASEIAQLAADVEVTVKELDQRIESLRAQIETESTRYRAISVATMNSPTDGRVWEILTAPGEDVHRGQELVRVLDCKGAVVTAAVSEANFNRIQIGDTATFRLRGEKEDLAGRVIGLHGLASVPANLAISHRMLTREPYHATVEVPALSRGADCQVGRTGIVIFQPASHASR
jgi:multidrug resistance efflux pump